MVNDVPKYFVDDNAFGKCPKCNAEFNSELISEYDIKYCPYCGQLLSGAFEEKIEFKCTECEQNYPNEDYKLKLIVKDGTVTSFLINDDGSLEFYDSDGQGQEIYLECTCCGQKFEFCSDDITLEELPVLRKYAHYGVSNIPIDISDLKYEKVGNK